MRPKRLGQKQQRGQLAFMSFEMTKPETEARLLPMKMPMSPPQMLKTMASMRNWIRMSRRFCAKGFAQADFTCSLCYGDQHNIHDPNAANEQGNTRNAT